ncbi:hypothetical protein ACRALDRAFT_2018067 [Sodiomyces alcalophilus JCM 7366]|uniref:uncharacterized protein n=1 Tax=Sodiomyces alcalophilus JCM 7366 TaxID=591952 RepID=UPI0039B617DA
MWMVDSEEPKFHPLPGSTGNGEVQVANSSALHLDNIMIIHLTRLYSSEPRDVFDASLLSQHEYDTKRDLGLLQTRGGELVRRRLPPSKIVPVVTTTSPQMWAGPTAAGKEPLMAQAY